MKKFLVYLLIIGGIVGVSVLYNKTTPYSHKKNIEYPEGAEENEERPDVVLSTAEKELNERRLQRALKLNKLLKSTSSTSSYVNGKITGSWEQFRFLTYNGSPYGFRTVGSVYDKENDVIYVISEPGHIWKINRDATNSSNTIWELMNHKGNYRNSYIDGLNMSDGSFRMIRSSSSGMQYSNDEGKSWVAASGVLFTDKSNHGAIVKKDGANKIFVLAKTSSSNVQVYVSTNDGVSYSPLSTKFNPSSCYVKLFRVHNSESVFLAVYDYGTQKVSIYEHEIDAEDFTLVNTSTNTFVSLDRMFGTYHNGTYHFYVATKYSYLYHTSDKGASWTSKQIDISNESGDTNSREVHPIKPNVVFRGYLDANVSINYGSTFSNFGHRLGWDVHHMKFYQRKDGSYFFFLGKDFGCYISDNPEEWSSYVSLNNNAPTQMCYDADHGQNYYSSFTANQDRGTVGFLNSSNESATKDVRTTDGFRVTLTNNDASVWTWMYFGTIYHKTNFEAGSSPLISINYSDSKWWAAPMIASPNNNEDAVYLATGNKLCKLTYNPIKKKIIKTYHYYDFLNKTGEKISGFAYSPINTKRWYVSVENGTFLYSEDGGQTFTPSSYTGILPRANTSSYNYTKNQHVIKASDIDEKTVYYAGVGNTFLISKDGGKTFTNHINGLDVYRIRDFDLSADEKFIYAACGTGGIWIYSLDDDQWYEMNDTAVPYVDFVDVEFIDKQNAIKFATFGSGILTFKPEGEYQSIVYPDKLNATINNEGNVELTWEDNSDNEDGFIIERTQNGEFIQIAIVGANTTTYTDSELSSNTHSFQYRVKAFNAADESFYSNYNLIIAPDDGVVSKSGWTLVSVDSEQANGYGAALAFDGDEGTMWHTSWNVSPIPDYPHNLVIDMNTTTNIKGFSYLPRQDASWNGAIKDYEFYVSTDKITWTKAASGSWAKTKVRKDVEFSVNHQARYIKLVGLSGIDNTKYASCAELSVYTEFPTSSVPNAPQFIQGGMLSDSEIELIWMDKSNDEDGFVVQQYIDGTFTTVHTTSADATSITFPDINKDETYWYRMYSFNGEGNSAYSDTLTIGSESLPDVGIYDMVKKEDIKVYPNPCVNELNIDYCLNSLFSEWQLLDMSGRVVRNGKVPVSANKVTIMTQGLKSGVYIVYLNGVNGSLSHKIIKE